MTSKLQEEIEYVHSNRNRKRYIRSYSFMFDVVKMATNTYTNLSLFWNDIAKWDDNEKEAKISALNDLYLLALLHINEEEWDYISMKNNERG